MARARLRTSLFRPMLNDLSPLTSRFSLRIHIYRRRTFTITPNHHTTASTSPPPDPPSMIKPQSRYSPPTSLLTRRSAYGRPLPTFHSLDYSWRWIKTFPIFVAVITVSALGMFNYQKVNSPVIAANLYALRTNPKVREILGDEVYFASRWAWISGPINLMQGRIDIKFSVKGTQREGVCRFKAKRFGGRRGAWTTEEWSLKVPLENEGEERLMQLLEEDEAGNVVDPMQGANF